MLSLFVALQVPVSSSSALTGTTKAPKIVAVISSQSGSAYNLKVRVQHGSRRVNSSVTSTRVSSNSKSCIVPRNKYTCLLRGLKKGAVLKFSIVTRFKSAASSEGKKVVYRVGDNDWMASTPSTTTTLPASLQSRSFSIYAPSASSGRLLPLVLLLHGYGSSGSLQETYMNLKSLAEREKFLLVIPDGTLNSNRERFWNAGSICCDFFNSRINDQQFLVDLIQHVSKNHLVDQQRKYLIGHSNGGAMAYRMACHHPEVFSAVASLAGIGQYEVSACNGSSPTGVLHIHGTADREVNYQGGLRFGKPYVGAVENVERWAQMNGCGAAVQDAGLSIDLVRNIDGADVRVTNWPLCTNGVKTALWTIDDGTHVPPLAQNFSSLVYAFLTSHSK
jgi:polyhydroxybutyrate depolymerase